MMDGCQGDDEEVRRHLLIGSRSYLRMSLSDIRLCGQRMDFLASRWAVNRKSGGNPLTDCPSQRISHRQARVGILA